jgi:hemoglobin
MARKTLYERLGGKNAILAVVDDFVARCAADSRINPKFARTDVPRLKAMLVEQVSAATGGPVTYTGRGMRETHDGMGVTAGEFDALVADLVATLKQFNVPAAEQQELLGILGPLRADIVEVETPQTGTPIPAQYKNAPPLARV